VAECTSDNGVSGTKHVQRNLWSDAASLPRLLDDPLRPFASRSSRITNLVAFGSERAAVGPSVAPEIGRCAAH
jgi:hypothetical protein